MVYDGIINRESEMKNSKRFRRSQDNQSHYQPKVSKYAAKQRPAEQPEEDRSWNRWDEMMKASTLANRLQGW